MKSHFRIKLHATTPIPSPSMVGSAAYKTQWRKHLALASLLAILGAPVLAATPWSITDLGTLGGTDSEARNINDYGQVVGYSLTNGDSTLHAFLYKGGAIADLSSSTGASNTATSINNNGQVVGYNAAYLGDRPFPFLYKGGVMTTLGDSSGRAWGIQVLRRR